MKDCNVKAKGKKGDERKQFMSVLAVGQGRREGRRKRRDKGRRGEEGGDAEEAAVGSATPAGWNGGALEGSCAIAQGDVAGGQPASSNDGIERSEIQPAGRG